MRFELWVNYAGFAAERNSIARTTISSFLKYSVRMAAPLRRFAIALFGLLFLSGSGCLAMRPCAPGDWHYRSCNGLELTRCQPRQPRNLVEVAPDKPRTARQPAAGDPPDDPGVRRLAAKAGPPAAKDTAVRKPAIAEVAECDWQEPETRPAQPKSPPASRFPPDASEHVQKPTAASPTMPTPDRNPTTASKRSSINTPFNWGFFGAATRE
jgi:hypothetical protein